MLLRQQIKGFSNRIVNGAEKSGSTGIIRSAIRTIRQFPAQNFGTALQVFRRFLKISRWMDKKSAKVVANERNYFD